MLFTQIGDVEVVILSSLCTEWPLGNFLLRRKLSYRSQENGGVATKWPLGNIPLASRKLFLCAGNFAIDPHKSR